MKEVLFMGLRQLFNSEYYNLIVSYDQKAWDHDTYRIDMEIFNEYSDISIDGTCSKTELANKLKKIHACFYLKKKLIEMVTSVT